MSEYDISAKITYDTGGATAAIGQTTRALGDNAKATGSAAEATTAASTNIAQFGSTVGLVGQTVGRFNGSLGSVVSSAGAALGAVQAMTTAGLGPLGLAIGIVTTTIGLASAAFAIFKGKQDQAEASTHALNRALDENAASLDTVIGKMRERDNLAAQRSRLASGGGSAEEYRGQADAQRERLRILQGEYGDSPAMRSARTRMLSEIRALEDRADAIERGGPSTEVTIEDMPMLTGAAAEAEARRLRHNGRTGGGRGGARRQTLDQLMGGGGGDLSSLAGARSPMDDLLTNDKDQLSSRMVENQQLAQDYYDRMREITQTENEKRQAIEQENADRLQAINDSVFAAIESGIQSSLDAWLSGSASAGEAAMQMVRGVAKALTSEAIMGALKETALALGATAVGNIPSATAHFGAAATWGAVGAAAATVGVATGAFGAPAGGSAPATGGPSLSGGERERRGDTIAINWGSQGLVYAADRAQLGRDLEDMIGEGRSRLGRAA